MSVHDAYEVCDNTYPQNRPKTKEAGGPNWRNKTNELQSELDPQF